ncbi:uncharacterized protein [Pseudorasbora parva]|uniref:uncharacterized protein isoform X2 n=1 Tax=Pseudorasbora parva TaxID=51549 RepID=UPI00351ED146
MYVIVEFLEEATCEMVPEIWLFKENEVQYCYWPLIIATKKIKKLEVPNKENWTRHRVRVFAKTADYETAKKWSKKAAVQSSDESSDDTHKRKKIPVCLSSSDEDTSSVARPQKKSRMTYTTTVEPQLPIPPVVKSFTTQKRNEELQIPDVSIRPTPTRDIQKHDHLLSLLTQKIISMESEMKAMRSSIAALHDLYARALGDGTGQRVEEMSLDVCGTMEEFLSLEGKLKEETFRKAVTHHLSLVGGPNPGENTRRVMRAVASYSVWKEFSLKGKKGKKPLENMTILKVIKKAVMTSNRGIHQAKVEDIVADTLKHAPARCQNVSLFMFMGTCDCVVTTIKSLYCGQWPCNVKLCPSVLLRE